MLKILHRVNNLNQLRETDPLLGVELDIHAIGSRLVVRHDAFHDGPDLEIWMKNYRHKFVIFNIKEEGIEERVCDLAEKHHIKDYFMLDLSFPSLINLVRRGESRVALRVSKYELTPSAMTLSGKVNWIWLDCFEGFPLGSDEFRTLKDAGFKICLVSPELHNPSRVVKDLPSMQKTMSELNVKVDAVCTKHPELW
jgi:hypothetical protein